MGIVPDIAVTEKQYLWRDPVFVDFFGSEFFPVHFTSQSRIGGMDGISRSLDLVLRVRRRCMSLLPSLASAWTLHVYSSAASCTLRTLTWCSQFYLAQLLCCYPLHVVPTLFLTGPIRQCAVGYQSDCRSRGPSGRA